ncbi:MAG: alpha-galactosidase [Blautia sp.]|nr:alpha-galactosidase [Eubacteriales bacterium]MED9967360.1 alpha-galactosidase [Blautia sp.]
MAIYYEEKNKIFRLDTKKSTYLIGLTPEGYVGHIYYGDRLFHDVDSCLLRMEEAPFTPSVNKREKSAFLDAFPMEYPTGGIGDYRESCLNIRNEQGCMGSEFHYVSHEIYKGKRALEGLPASFGNEDEVETLEILMEDPVLEVSLVLCYSAFEKENVITRNVRICNHGKQTLKLEKVYSACLDMDNEEFEMITLCGSWARERRIQRHELHYGKQSASSAKGESSHQEHPFLALVTPGTNQLQGKVYAMNFVYSGNFLAQAELSQFDSVRMVMGINREEFCWNLRKGETFQAPEAVLVYSGEGLGEMTRSFHDFYRNHMIRSPYLHKKRPILINNWEATYFDFDTDKLLAIAREAKKSGIEMLVMDDGWFGERNLDNSSLGDWTVNEKKIKGGLKHLVDEVNAIGLEFGIWFEPEMISPDSELYRKHPEWAIQIPSREATQSRCQYVLDLSRPEVQDYAYECVAKILRSANIAYVKWDMNRQLSDLGSSWLDRESQQELFHRYVLGLYRMQERLVTEFPNLLLENCSGGGARFDPGMLYYSPQIWCSDDTDAVERLAIQEGTAFIYPLSAMGAHVSDCPNHAVGRVTPFETRGHVALAGTFGYELDITKIPQEDRDMIPRQTEMYHKYHELIREGDYYRIASYRENNSYDCWAVAAKDKSEVLVTYVQVLAGANRHSRKIYFQGFDSNALYRLEGTKKTYSGERLMKMGFLMEALTGDFRSRLYHFVKTEEYH